MRPWLLSLACVLAMGASARAQDASPSSSSSQDASQFNSAVTPSTGLSATQGGRILAPDEMAILTTRCAPGQGDPDNRGCRSQDWITADALAVYLNSLGTDLQTTPSYGSFNPSGSAVMSQDKAFRDPFGSNR